jgi:uncharacterized membrane protein
LCCCRTPFLFAGKNAMKNIILIIHIICGSIALLSGPVAMLRQDGKLLHRISGKIFFYAMTIVFITAVYLSVADQLIFLLLIAVFSYYNIVAAYRALYLKRLGRGQKPEVMDWTILCITSVFHLALLVWGSERLISGNSFGIVALVFAVIGLLTNLRECRTFTKGYKEKNGWLYAHITGMTGGYIASLTAFLVNVVSFQPAFILWIAPTVVFTPFIIYTIGKFRRKIKSGRKMSDLSELRIALKEDQNSPVAQ